MHAMAAATKVDNEAPFARDRRDTIEGLETYAANRHSGVGLFRLRIRLRLGFGFGFSFSFVFLVADNYSILTGRARSLATHLPVDLRCRHVADDMHTWSLECLYV